MLQEIIYICFENIYTHGEPSLNNFSKPLKKLDLSLKCLLRKIYKSGLLWAKATLGLW